MILKCPECGETEVEQLKPNLLDQVARLFGAIPYRCSFCHTFFHSSAKKSPPTEPEQSIPQTRRAA